MYDRAAQSSSFLAENVRVSLFHTSLLLHLLHIPVKSEPSNPPPPHRLRLTGQLSREETLRRKWQPCDSRSGRVESYSISILCQEGALKAQTLATVAEVCDSIFAEMNREKWIEMKSFAKIFSFFFFLVSLSTKSTLHTEIQIHIQSGKSPTVERPWSILRFNTSLEGS